MSNHTNETQHDEKTDDFKANPQSRLKRLRIKHYLECRDMFVVGSVSWKLLNDKIEAVSEPF